MINTNMPSVEGAKGTKPALTFPGTDAPEGLQVQVLDAGDGKVVEAGDTIVAHYLGQVWNGDVFDNSYDRGQPLDFQVGVGMVIRGWDDALVGQRVGSRLLLRARLRRPRRSAGRHQGRRHPRLRHRDPRRHLRSDRAIA